MAAMRRLTAALVLAVFVSLSAVDALCCPDGCTDGTTTAAATLQHASDAGTCMQCLGGLNAPVALALVAGATLSAPLLQVVFLTPDTGAADPPDQPPRL
jgi:hypothetical protein